MKMLKLSPGEEDQGKLIQVYERLDSNQVL